MPYRVVLLWQFMGVPAAVVAGLSALVGVITSDGIAVAITVIGTAFVVVLGRALPILKEMGMGFLEFRGRMKRQDQELAQTKAIATEAVVGVQGNQSAIVDIRKEAQDAKEETARAKDEAVRMVARAKEEARAESAAEIADLRRKMSDMEREAADKRHAFANKIAPITDNLQTDLFEAHQKIADLEARIATLVNGDTARVAAINTLSDSVTILAEHLPPPPVVVETPHLEPLQETPPVRKSNL